MDWTKRRMLAEDSGAGTGAGVSAGEGAAATGGQEQTGASDFQTLIGGQYRQEFEQEVGRRIQAAIQDRFRNQRDLKGQLDKYQPIMQALGPKYGLDPSDVDGIAKRLTDDDSLYAEEASREGLPVKTYKAMMHLKAENARLNEKQQQSAEEQEQRRHFQTLVQQAEELKKTFPNFDLMEEMRQNPRFVRMTAPGVGLSVQDAYYAIHGRDIQQQSMQYAAQQAEKRIADSVRSGASRPAEGGMQSTQQARVSVDPSKLTAKELRDIARRVKAGERIDFINNS